MQQFLQIAHAISVVLAITGIVAGIAGVIAAGKTPRFKTGVQFYELIPTGKNLNDMGQIQNAIGSVLGSLSSRQRCWFLRYWDGDQLHLILGMQHPKHSQAANQLASEMLIDLEPLEGFRASGLTKTAHVTGRYWQDYIWKPGPQQAEPLPAGVGAQLMAQKGPAMIAMAFSTLPAGIGQRHRNLLASRMQTNARMAAEGGHHHNRVSGLFRASLWVATGPEGNPQVLTRSVMGPLSNRFCYNNYPWPSWGAGPLLLPVAWSIVLVPMMIGSMISATLGVLGLLAMDIPAAVVAYRIYRSGGRPAILCGRGTPDLRRHNWATRAKDRQLTGVDDVTMGGKPRTLKNWATRYLVWSSVELAPLFAPPIDTDQTGTGLRAASRPAPATMLQPKGVPLGVDPRDRVVWGDPRMRREGIFVTGDPGQGKTVFCLNIWGYDLARRIRLHRQDESCHIWFETKGEGAARAYKQATLAGIDPAEILMLDVTSDLGPRLELVDRSDPERAANEMTEAMRYAFPEGAIEGRSADVLKRVWGLIFSIPENMASRFSTGRLPSDLDMLLMLLGDTRNPEALARFMRVLKTEAGFNESTGHYEDVGPAADQLRRALERWAYFSDMRERDREEILRPSIGRLSSLRPVSCMFKRNPDRPIWSFRRILMEHRVVILNFGSGQVTPDIARTMSAMALYILNTAINEVCEDWERTGQSVGLYCDELASVCGLSQTTSADVVASLKDAGRSRGVQQVYATQRMEQLPETTRQIAGTFGIKLYLRAENREVAQSALEDLIGRELKGYSPTSQYTAEDIRNLPEMEGILRARDGQTAQLPFNLRVVPEAQLDVELLAQVPYGQ